MARSLLFHGEHVSGHEVVNPDRGILGDGFVDLAGQNGCRLLVANYILNEVATKYVDLISFGLAAEGQRNDRRNVEGRPMRRMILPVGLLALLLLVGGQATAASMPILDFTGGIGSIMGPLPDGWDFPVVPSPITVGAPGLWDEGPVASASSAGDWRFSDINPPTSSPDHYVLGVTFGREHADWLRFDTNTPSTRAGVTFDVPRAFGCRWPRHLHHHHHCHEIGPEAVSAPTPSSLLLFGPTLAGVAGVAWRRHRRK